MKSPLPKVAHQLAGVPLVVHVLQAVLPLRPDPIVVIVPPNDTTVSGLVVAAARCVPQPELLGTGHALMQARSALGTFSGDLLVLCGDAPLLSGESLERLVAFHRAEKLSATVLTARLEDPSGYGRIVRKASGRVGRIVEETDADVFQRAVEEVNSGTYCFRSPEIWGVLDRIGHANRQNEHYLTDAVHLLAESGAAVDGCLAVDPDDILGINNRADLARAESALQKRIVGRLHRRGITVVSPAQTYIQALAEIGEDSIIFPFTLIERGARVGASCRIGPFACIRSGEVVPDGTDVRGSLKTKI
jgi:bifunctional UDP-N-acetylglucosamine pyrophosphorylase/glucosamine-1-phosphate N-acetyltransferase